MKDKDPDASAPKQRKKRKQQKKVPPKGTKLLNAVVSLDVAAQFADCTSRHLRNLIQEGFIKRVERGECVLLEALHGRIRSLQAVGKATTKTAAQSRVHDARAAEIELRMVDRKKTLVNEAITQARDVAVELIGGMKADLLAVPARITTDVVLRRRIEEAIDECLASAARRAADQETDPPDSDGDLGSEAEKPTRRVGARKPRVSAERGDSGPA